MNAALLLVLLLFAASGTKVTVKVTSANGRIPVPGSDLRSAAVSLKVDAGCGQCSVTAEKGRSNLQAKQQPQPSYLTG